MSQRCWEIQKRYYGDGPIKNKMVGESGRKICRFCFENRGITKPAYWQCPQADLIGKDIDPNDPRIDWVPTCDECAEGWWDGAKWGPIPFRMVG